MVKRIQLRRTRGWRIPENTVKVDRSTKWGNPFVPGKPCAYSGGRPIQDKRHAANIYAAVAPDNEVLVAAARAELEGKNLGCWCGLCDLHAGGKPFGEDCPTCDRCHGDTLGAIANGLIR
jgi:hypothetical protein